MSSKRGTKKEKTIPVINPKIREEVEVMVVQITRGKREVGVDTDCIHTWLNEESWRRWNRDIKPCAVPLFLLGNEVDHMMVKRWLAKLVPAVLFL